MPSKKTIFCLLLLVTSMVGCSLDGLVKASDPEEDTELSREYLYGIQGAMGLVNAGRGNLQAVVSSLALDIGLLTDELTVRPDNHTDFSTAIGITSDVRFELLQISNGFRVNGLVFPDYNRVHTARISSSQGRQLLRELHDPSLSYAISGSYAVEAYSILLIAENMCSGAPLSEVPFEGQATYGKSLRTEEIFQIAVSKFDSALQIPHDSARYITLARIGKGRALMGLGEYEKAADAVKDVQPTDKFELRYAEVQNPGRPINNVTGPADAFWSWIPAGTAKSRTNAVEVANNEGVNGMVWYVDAMNMDPRVPMSTVTVGGITTFEPVVRQRKFINAGVTFQLAKWAEAKLIEAEYRLSNSDASWIDPINEARRSIGLIDTVSPTSTTEKVNLLFRERAYWFYGEGVRLADFRRLVRQYNRSPFAVYPTGAYTKQRNFPHYGDAFVYVPHINEYLNNHEYSGCFHENP